MKEQSAKASKSQTQAIPNWIKQGIPGWVWTTVIAGMSLVTGLFFSQKN